MGEGAKWQIVATVAAVALAVFGVVRMLDAGAPGGRSVRVSGGGVSGGGVSGGGDSAPRPAGPRQAARARGPVVVVHVAGAVRRPGVYRLALDARVAAAVRRAGGPAKAADLGAVNLAAPLADGQQVIVPARLGLAGAAASAAGAGGESPISLATASAAELEELDGIGETLAERIVDYRTEHGGLASIDQLGEVDGIGEKRLEALKDELRP